MRPPKTVTVELDESRPFIMVANRDWWREVVASEDIMNSSLRRKFLERKLKQKKYRNFESLWRLMHTDPIQQKITIYTCIMIPKYSSIYMDFPSGEDLMDNDQDEQDDEQDEEQGVPDVD
jgi:hypothetical protein